MAGNNFVARYLGGIRDDVERRPASRAPRGADRGLRPPRARSTRPASSAAPPAAPRADAEKINASWSDFDVLVTPTVGETAIEVGRWDGKGALRTLLGMSRTYCFTPIWNHTGQPAAAVPGRVHRRAGCRAR